VAVTEKNIVVLVGGVGGAKLALGLQQILKPENLTIVVNTGDDFWHYGLRVCPDIDTVLYTLSGRVNKENGWGLVNESTTTLQALRDLGEETWFLLGDKDIATHMLRSEMLRRGSRLTEIVARLARGMGIDAKIVPMTDAPVATMVNTDIGELEFQEYFVKHRWQPVVKSLRYQGIENARLSPEVKEALAKADVLLIAPSNPWLSIAPILAVEGMKEGILARDIPRVAVTPIVEGKAIKGPAAKLMDELGYEVSGESVAAFYEDLITGFVYDVRDKDINKSNGTKSIALDTIMLSDDDKARLAQQILTWIDEKELA
jgi:LPPG:FO 2-phospho-L-lactate transferase